MKNTIARFFLFVAAFTSAFAQPMIPVNNISPVNANSLIGNIGASGRAESIPLGAGLSFVGGALVAGSGGGSAPSDGTYITQIPNASLTNEQPLSLLATGLVYVTTSTGVLTSLVPGTVGNVVISNGTSWVSSLPAGNVTAAATLASGNILLGQGGKAVASSSVFTISGSNATVTGNLTITGSTTFNNLTTANLVVTGTFDPGSWVNPVANGGTGVATLTANAVITGNGTGAVTSVAPGTNGNLLTSNGTAWTSAAPGFGTGNVTGSGLTANAIIIGAGSSAISVGASPGTSGNILTSNGTAWTSAAASAGTVTVTGTPTSGQLAEWTSATNLQGISTAGVTQGGSGRATGTTAYSIIATGTTATGAQQTLANGATTEILVGGGAAALPVWTTASGTGAPARVGSPTFTGNIVLASGTGPTTGAVAATAFDTDAWAASRGAVQVHDGTANTFLVGALASDTPSNGQVPTWNTGGTITWETGGGSGNVTGPGSSTDRAIATWNSTGGTVLRDNSAVTIDASSNIVTTGNITGNQHIGQALIAKGGALAASTANTTALDYLSGTNDARWFAFGPDPSTVGKHQIRSARSDGSSAIVVMQTDTSGNVVWLGNITTTGVILTTSTVSGGVLVANGVLPSNAASRSAFDHLTSAGQNLSRWIAQGPDASTNARFQLRSSRSDGSNAIIVMESDVSGNVTFEQAITGNITTASTSTTTGSGIFKGGVGVAGRINAGGSITPSQTGGIVGTTTNNSADAGSVGQYIESLVAVGSAVSLTTATAANVTSISLTAGDWDVSGIVNYSASAATVTATSGGITSTSATVPTDGSEGYSGVQLVTASATDSVTLPRKRMSLSGTTTVYLVASRTFSIGSTAAFGTINARRVR